MHKHLILLALVAAFALAGCSETPEAEPGSTASQLPDVAGLTVAWQCGHGFWVGNGDQTLAIRFQAHDANALATGAAPAVVTLPDPDERWSGTLTLGRDLYANWCDDVIEEGEPEPVVAETWAIAAGTIEIVAVPPVDECGPAHGWARGLVAEADDGRTVEIDDLRLINPAWGCFAG
ncbi:MAG: hypothetical protein OEU32_18035 [Acidimicrobiia bacterium]|nr:hypothetical protein [Acidimicrobiia bacterium]